MIPRINTATLALALALALALLLAPARAQFIETYARSVSTGAGACACGGETPCQHIASTIVHHALGYGKVQCTRDKACPVWDASKNNSLAGQHFFFCCAEGHAPLASCAERAVEVTVPESTSTTSSKRAVQVVVRETTRQTTTTTASPKRAVEVTVPETTRQPTTTTTTTNASTNASNPQILQVAGPGTASAPASALCGVGCLLGVSAGMGALLLFALLLLLHRRHTRRAQLAAVERDLSDLQHQNFRGEFHFPQPLYEEIDPTDQDYEEPVPISSPQSGEGKRPLAFHNPLYNGPMPLCTGEQPAGMYAVPRSFSPPDVHVYDLGEEVEA